MLRQTIQFPRRYQIINKMNILFNIPQIKSRPESGFYITTVNEVFFTIAKVLKQTRIHSEKNTQRKCDVCIQKESIILKRKEILPI